MILHAREALLPEGWAEDVTVRIAAGRIAEVGTASGMASGAADHRVDVLLPAPVNLHSHTFQRAMSGLTEARGPDPADSFWTWRRLMYRFLDALTPEDVEAIAALAFMEMLEAGYGAVAEFHYLHHAVGGVPYAALGELSGRIAAAAETAGIGLTLLPVLYQRGGCDGRALEGGQRRFGNDPERYAALLEGASGLLGGVADARLGVAPHSLRAVDAAGLAAAQDLAQGGPLHLHLAEQVAEVTEVEAHLGARPVEWLVDNAPVGPEWCLIHCTQITGEETHLLARTRAVAGLCPITEANLGDGIFNGVGWHAASGRMGVGTDSNVEIALWGELRLLEYGQRLRDRARAVLAAPGQAAGDPVGDGMGSALGNGAGDAASASTGHSTGRALYDAVCAGGAQAAGRQSGAIAPGKWADLTAIARSPDGVTGRRDTTLDAAVFGAHGARAVTDVWSAGRHVVSDGRHRAREAIAARYGASLARLESTL